MGASAAVRLIFKKELIEVTRKADSTITNIHCNESRAELKALVPYALYRDGGGIGRLREKIEAKNEGAEVLPFTIR
jgi:hypothetical protein